MTTFSYHIWSKIYHHLDLVDLIHLKCSEKNRQHPFLIYTVTIQASYVYVPPIDCTHNIIYPTYHKHGDIICDIMNFRCMSKRMARDLQMKHLSQIIEYIETHYSSDIKYYMGSKIQSYFYRIKDKRNTGCYLFKLRPQYTSNYDLLIHIINYIAILHKPNFYYQTKIELERMTQQEEMEYIEELEAI